MYIFTHRGKASFSTSSQFRGTAHADDLIPLFPLRKTSFYSSIPSDQDREVTKVMSLMWTNFARFGLVKRFNDKYFARSDLLF